MICPEIGNSGNNAFIGGHTNNVIRLSKALHNRGHEITIITTPHRHPGDQPSEDLEWAKVVCLPINGSFSSIGFGLEFALKSFNKIRKINGKSKFDIIHGHSGFTMPAIITGITSMFLNIPSVHSVYCPIQVNSKSTVKFLSNNALSRFYFFHIDKVIATSGSVLESLVNAGIAKEKIDLIPPLIGNNFNSSVSGEKIREEFNILPEQTVVTFVGNLSKIKGIDILIDSLSYLKEEYHDIMLLMVLNLPLSKYNNPEILEADAELLPEIKRKIKSYGLEENVIPIGLTEKMPQIMAASDIFTMPFLNLVGVADPPISLIEAMAIGKPVIATKVGSVSKLVKHKVNGILIDPGSSVELAEGIKYLIENEKESKEMGKRGSKMIHDNFGDATIIKKIENVYESVGV
ncbi:MAG: glycosyltransferase family 4 protein [Halobacteriota archaeon]|nr:glycosyltransferase family 4 protein [Halobacteriota archaeon]